MRCSHSKWVATMGLCLNMAIINWFNEMLPSHNQCQTIENSTTQSCKISCRQPTSIVNWICTTFRTTVRMWSTSPSASQRPSCASETQRPQPWSSPVEKWSAPGPSLSSSRRTPQNNMQSKLKRWTIKTWRWQISKYRTSLVRMMLVFKLNWKAFAWQQHSRAPTIQRCSLVWYSVCNHRRWFYWFLIAVRSFSQAPRKERKYTKHTRISRVCWLNTRMRSSVHGYRSTSIV